LLWDPFLGRLRVPWVEKRRRGKKEKEKRFAEKGNIQGLAKKRGFQGFQGGFRGTKPNSSCCLVLELSKAQVEREEKK